MALANGTSKMIQTVNGIVPSGVVSGKTNIPLMTMSVRILRKGIEQ